MEARERFFLSGKMKRFILSSERREIFVESSKKRERHAMSSVKSSFKFFVEVDRKVEL